MKNHISYALFFMILMGFILSAPLSAEENKFLSDRTSIIIPLTDSEIAWLKAHPDILLGYTDTFEPDVIVNPDGTYRGIQVDILNELNRRLGTRIHLQIETVPEIIAKAQKKEVDGVLSLHPGYADKLGLLKTRSYITGYPAVFARKDVPFRSPLDFAGRKVAIIDKVFFSEELVEQHGKEATVLKVKDAEEALQFIENGQADFFLGATLNAYLITKYQILDLATQYIFYNDPIDTVIGTRSDWPELSAILDKGLSNFSEEEIEAIVARWTHLPQPKAILKLTAEEQAWIAQNHAIRVSFWLHPPYFYSKDGKVVGMAVDLLNVVSKKTGLTFQFENRLDRFSDVLKGLKGHEGPDLVGALMPTPEREKAILFTEPYINSPRFIFTRDDAPFISSIENLFGKKVAVVKDYDIHKNLVAEYPGIDLLAFDNNEEALRAVSLGKAMAFIGDLVSTPAMINEFGLKNLKAPCPSGLPDHPLAMGIRNDWPELRDILCRALAEIPAAEKAAMINKWSTVRVEHGIRQADVMKRLLMVVGVAALIVLLFLVWNRQLTRKVKQRTAEVVDSEARFRATFEQAAVGITHVSPEGRFLRINQKFCDIVGFSHEEMLRKTFQDITYPDDLDADLESMNHLLAGKIDTYAMEKRYIRKDGGLVWIHLTVSLVRNEAGEPQWFVAVIKDISDRKQAEQKLLNYQQKLKALVSQLTVAEERERRRIAADLHDHVGQSLALARIQMSVARKSTSLDKRNAILDEVSESLIQAVQDTRDVIYDLSPPQMNEISLAAAISEWLEEQIEKRHGLKTELIDDGQKKPLNDDLRAILFRNVRELLANVVKHARAGKVTVFMEDFSSHLKIIVQDDGVGFKPLAASKNGKQAGGFGLFSIQERMSDLGGSLEIESEPGRGCRAILTAPLDLTLMNRRRGDT